MQKHNSNDIIIALIYEIKDITQNKLVYYYYYYYSLLIYS